MLGPVEIGPLPAWTFAGGRFGRYLASLLWPSALIWGVGEIPAEGISYRGEISSERKPVIKKENLNTRDKN